MTLHVRAEVSSKRLRAPEFGGRRGCCSRTSTYRFESPSNGSECVVDIVILLLLNTFVLLSGGCCLGSRVRHPYCVPRAVVTPTRLLHAEQIGVEGDDHKRTTIAESREKLVLGVVIKW